MNNVVNTFPFKFKLTKIDIIVFHNLLIVKLNPQKGYLSRRPTSYVAPRRVRLKRNGKSQYFHVSPLLGVRDSCQGGRLTCIDIHQSFKPPLIHFYQVSSIETNAVEHISYSALSIFSSAFPRNCSIPNNISFPLRELLQNIFAVHSLAFDFVDNFRSFSRHRKHVYLYLYRSQKAVMRRECYDFHPERNVRNLIEFTVTLHALSIMFEI